MKIRSICLTAHPFKDIPKGLGDKIIKKLQSFGIKIYAEPWLNKHFDNQLAIVHLDQISICDAVVVIGGDGTLLHVVPWAVKADIPILAINVGRVGFLTQVEQDELDEALEALCLGAYTFDERMLLEVTYNQREKRIALNDVVVSRGSYSRLITLNSFISEEFVEKYVADGLIISTPTGSTAYSLSAGGPIISPKVGCMIMTPICPHSLKHRPIVVSEEEKIRLEIILEKGFGIHLEIDGHHPILLQDHGIVEITKAKEKVKLIRLKPLNFFSLVRKKLLEWSQ